MYKFGGDKITYEDFCNGIKLGFFKEDAGNGTIVVLSKRLEGYYTVPDISPFDYKAIFNFSVGNRIVMDDIYIDWFNK